MSRVAIVGGSSALGRRLVPILRDRHDVVTLGRTGCDIPCDLLGPLDSIAMPSPLDSVVHLAAVSHATTGAEMVRMAETNAVGALKVCVAAEAAGARHVVLVSSVYAASLEGAGHDDLYAITKRQAEQLAAEACRRGQMLLTVLRPAPLYGDDMGFRRHQPLLSHIVDCAAEGRDIHFYGRHDARRNYLYADDMAAVISGVLDHAPGGLHTCTFPADFSLSEIASAALDAFGRGGRFDFLADKPDVPDNVFGNATELYDMVGFRPEVDIREGMQRLALRRKETNP
jgi:nucleoside-diphosphate-sugar epimerase